MTIPRSKVDIGASVQQNGYKRAEAVQARVVKNAEALRVERVQLGFEISQLIFSGVHDIGNRRSNKLSEGKEHNSTVVAQVR